MWGGRLRLAGWFHCGRSLSSGSPDDFTSLPIFDYVFGLWIVWIVTAQAADKCTSRAEEFGCKEDTAGVILEETRKRRKMSEGNPSDCADVSRRFVRLKGKGPMTTNETAGYYEAKCMHKHHRRMP